MNSASFSVRRALAPVALGLAIALSSGCAYLNPVQTQAVYPTSDGTQGEIGEGLLLRNMLVITAAEGAPGTLVGSVVNRTDSDADVLLEGTSEDGSLAFSHSVSVPAGATLQIGGPERAEETLIATSVPVVPGAMLDLYSEAGGESTTISLPILDGTLSEYAHLVPPPVE